MTPARLPSALLVLAACAHSPSMPGPLSHVGRTGSVWPTVEPKVEEAVAAVATPPPPAPSRPPPRPEPSRHDDPLVTAARDYLDHPPPSRFRDDCSGFVCAVYDKAGLPLSGNTASLWADAQRDHRIHRNKRPDPGDLAFFDDTWDRNGNGLLDDPLTHVAIVLEVEDDGTITMAHAGTSKGRSTLRMNLRRPADATDDDGTVLNDALRVQQRQDPPRTAYLAGQLWRGFAHPPSR